VSVERKKGGRERSGSLLERKEERGVGMRVLGLAINGEAVRWQRTHIIVDMDASLNKRIFSLSRWQLHSLETE